MINLGKTIWYNLQSSRLCSFHETNILLQWQKIVEGLQTLNDPFCFCVTAVFWVRFAEGSVWRISTLVLVEESFRCSCYLLLLKYTNNNLNGCVTTDARVAGWMDRKLWHKPAELSFQWMTSVHSCFASVSFTLPLLLLCHLDFPGITSTVIRR